MSEWYEVREHERGRERERKRKGVYVHVCWPLGVWVCAPRRNKWLNCKILCLVLWKCCCLVHIHCGKNRIPVFLFLFIYPFIYIHFYRLRFNWQTRIKRHVVPFVLCTLLNYRWETIEKGLLAIQERPCVGELHTFRNLLDFMHGKSTFRIAYYACYLIGYPVIASCATSHLRLIHDIGCFSVTLCLLLSLLLILLTHRRLRHRHVFVQILFHIGPQNYQRSRSWILLWQFLSNSFRFDL